MCDHFMQTCTEHQRIANHSAIYRSHSTMNDEIFILIQAILKRVRIFGPYTGILDGVNDVISWHVPNRLLSFIAQIVAFYMRKQDCYGMMYPNMIFMII